jgi:hypothetical protein
VGLKDQNLLPEVPTLAISLADRPRLPVMLNRGKEVGHGHPDAGGGGVQLGFSPADIGAPPQKVRGQAHRHHRRRGRDGGGGGQLPGQKRRFLAEEHPEGVDGVLGRGLQPGNQGLGGGHLGIGVGHIQAADKTGLKAFMGNGRGLFLGFQVLAGDENLLLETPEIEIIEAHLPHQGHQHVPAILHRGL